MRTVVVALLAGFLLVVPGGGSAQAASCPAPAYPSTTGSFNPEVKAKHVPCGTATKVVLKHYACRTEKSQTGFCVHKVAQGWGCREQRTSLGDSYVATVTCGRGNADKRVSFGYQQYYG